MSPRHLLVRLPDRPDDVVLDFGCGDTLMACDERRV